MKSVLWLGGWGCAPEATLAFAREVLPEAEHRTLAPVPGCIENLDTSDVNAIVGYSTGAFLLCGTPQVMTDVERVILVAPFCDFRAESGRGGKTPAGKIRFLLRWLKRDPLAALQDFYQRAGLGEPPSALPYTEADLIWGIEQLFEVAQPSPVVAGGDMEDKLTVLAGDADPLLNAEALRADFPALRVVPGAGHALADFRKELDDALR